jgi:hypothetical protein
VKKWLVEVGIIVLGVAGLVGWSLLSKLMQSAIWFAACVLLAVFWIPGVILFFQYREGRAFWQ